MNIKEYSKKAKDRVSCYFTRRHDNITHFVLDMESRGIPRDMMRYYFPVVVFMNTNVFVEIIGVDPHTNEIITNTAFNEKGEYSGHSYILEDGV